MGLKRIDEKTDIRFRILWHLYKEDFGMEQHCANQFLSSLKTSINTTDLGSIRRALFDLKEQGLIKETQDNVDIKTFDELRTSGFGADADYSSICSPDRFVKTVGAFPQIRDIYIGITMKGIEFLINHDNSVLTTMVNRKQNRTFYAVLALAFATAIIGVAQLFVACYCSS